uniref:Uncharacterized protein n=1 Tax=virus sp. ctx9V1 TaxID=2828001 RepID=A0A8S5RD02_9VIRU|nr:MAG TPA: hypothetical protein [virus sp. ctx9V1]
MFLIFHIYIYFDLIYKNGISILTNRYTCMEIKPVDN